MLDTHAFDEFAEAQCAPSYEDRSADRVNTPARIFRLLLIGYFEGVEPERGISWQVRLVADRHVINL